MFDSSIKAINESRKVIIIQAENPDGDSLGTSLALEDIIGNLGKEVVLYCPIEIPKYMRYIKGWDRVESDFDTSADLAIIVDTAADILLTRVLETPGVRHYLETHKVLVIDHHVSASNLSFQHELVTSESVASAVVVFNLASTANWPISQVAADNLMVAILSDSLGFSVEGITPETFYIAGKLTEYGASCSDIEKRRREHMKKSPEILKYKGQLLERIDYALEGKMAYIHIPWDEIKEYSDQYNPSVLVLDEMRLVNDVEIAVAIKTYPDGKLTGKIRSNIPIATNVAGYFGGGGHEYASGFRVYETIDKILPELIAATDKAIKEHHDSSKAS